MYLYSFLRLWKESEQFFQYLTILNLLLAKGTLFSLIALSLFKLLVIELLLRDAELFGKGVALVFLKVFIELI